MPTLIESYPATATDVTVLTTSVWLTWVQAVGESLVTTASTWGDWNDVTRGWASTATNSTLWQDWNRQGTITLANGFNGVVQAAPDSAALQGWRREQEEARARAQSRRAAASVRAKSLLLQHLTSEQRAEYEKHQWFTVISKSSRRRYRVRHGFAGNVDLLDAKGAPVRGRRYCCHPTHDVPVPNEDAMLAQKLMLEYDEAEFLRLANVS